MSNKSTRYRAAGGIVVDDAQVLLLYDKRADEWRLPKGHVEAGESDEEAALREVAEETGLADLVIVADLGHQTVEFDGPSDHVVRDERFFVMRKSGDGVFERPKKDAARFDVRWVPRDDALQLLTFQAEREWVRRSHLVDM